MRENKQFASRMAAALAVAALVGTSAFAETRHSEETDAQAKSGGIASIESLSSDESQNQARSEYRRNDRGDDRRGDHDYDRNRERNDRDRSDRYRDDRYRSDRYRDDRYRDDRSRNDRFRNDGNRSDRDRSYRSEHRRPYFTHGRVSRVHRYGSGYRVYVHGAHYPFFIPDHYYRHDRFRVGIDVRLGGYYNSGGYYDYYDGRYAASRADLTGVVESVDYRRNTFVMRNDATGSFVTVFMRDRDGRRELRAGDSVEVYGDWSRNGLFQAYDIDLLDRY